MPKYLSGKLPYDKHKEAAERYLPAASRKTLIECSE